jgi:hypothetical protein
MRPVALTFPQWMWRRGFRYEAPKARRLAPHATDSMTCDGRDGRTDGDAAVLGDQTRRLQPMRRMFGVAVFLTE